MRQSEITELLDSIRVNEPDATDKLFNIIYNDLRAMARSQMAREKVGHTLQPTALVHEAFIRLTNSEDVSWENRRHFFGAAAEAMRRILIDYARRRNCEKRGGDMQRVTLDDQLPEHSEEETSILALSDALDQLESRDAEMAEIVKLRYFAGLTIEETANIVNCSARTVNRQWTAARAWLRVSLDVAPEQAGP